VVEQPSAEIASVSTVIPTYRRPHQLAEAISSVLDQPLHGDILVVDDCPDGSAQAVVEKFSPQIVRYTKHEPPSRGRPALVRNAGWPLVRGRYVHFLDDDDRVGPEFYFRAIECFARRPAIGVVFGNVLPYAADSRADISSERSYFEQASRRARVAAFIGSRRWLTASLLFRSTVLVNSACIVRREVIDELGGYRTDLELNEDVDFFCRAIRRHGFRFVDAVAVHYRINHDSLMHGRSDDGKLVNSYEKMRRKYQEVHGSAELHALKIAARTLGRFL
jgi:glycosyltransferase involved in cell wall biosynthesis